MCNSGNAVRFSRADHWKTDFRPRRVRVSGFCCCIRCVLNSSNRYIRIVKSNYYNKIFSPRKSKIWLSYVWLSLTLYLLSRVTIWNTFKFHPAFAICTVTFTTTEDRIIHYCFVLGLFFVLSFFVGLFSYYKMFLKIRRHEVYVAPSLQNSRNQAGRTSVQVINMSRTLACVAGGFLLCWILMWTFILWRRFSPDTAP